MKKTNIFLLFLLVSGIFLFYFIKKQKTIENNIVPQKNINKEINIKNIDTTVPYESIRLMKKITTDTGLAYEILIEPSLTAKNPQPGNTVVVHYTGWLNDNGQPGRKFDSSVDRGQHFSFPVGMGYVIAGWDETLLSMKVGEKRRVYIPSNLGYGARGAGALIPPGADLIFDIEFIAIK